MPEAETPAFTPPNPGLHLGFAGPLRTPAPIMATAAWLVQACYRPKLVRVFLLPCHIGMCIPSAGTALGIYASKAWVVTATLLLGH